MANKNISGDVNVEFTEAQSRQSLESGESVKTLFGKLRKWLTDLKPVAFSGSYNDLSNKPTIPSSATITGAVNGTGALSGVPVNRKSCYVGNGGGSTITNSWFLTAQVDVAQNSYVYKATFYVELGIDTTLSNVGILEIVVRKTSGTLQYMKAKWIVGGSGINLNDFALSYDSTSHLCSLYINRPAAYSVYRLTSIAESERGGGGDKADVWTLYNNTSTGIASPPSGTGITTIYSELADTHLSQQVNYNTDNGVKNLLEITTETQTINGVTFTVDKVAGTVTANGTASSTIWSFILIQNKIYPYDVIISGCPQGGNWSDTYSIQTDSVDGVTYYDFGDGVTFPKGKSLLLRIVIRSGYTANNLVFKPMIRSANITDSTFVPYAEPNHILTRNSKLSETSDTTPYIYKASEHDAVYDELVGGSVAWNQLVANSGSSLSVTITSGHKYVMKKNGTLSVGASSGSAITGFTGGTDWITDLTLMFGTTIADYVYNLEQSTAGSGIVWLKSYGFFTKDYYAYNAGGLISVNVSGKKVVNETTEITYPIQSTDLRGLYKLDANNGLYTDGDIYSADGTVTRMYGIVDLGTLNWGMTTNNRFYANVEQGSTGIITNALCSKYVITNTAFSNLQDKEMNYGQPVASTGWRAVAVRDSAYTDATTFKTAMSGVYLIYELATPITETASPYTSPQMVYRQGTEEFIDTRDVPIPVGGNRKYVDIPEWMVNEYFDDVRAEASIALPTTGGTINGDLDVNGLLDVHNAYVRDDLTVGENLTVCEDLTVNPGHSINCRRISRTADDREAEITLETLPAIDFYVSDSGVSSQLHFSAGYFGINDATMIYSDAPSGTGTSLALDSSYNIVKVTSSRDTKHDINYVEDTKSYHDALMQLKPATFIYNSDKTETPKLGMIAEDVADVCPIAGMTDKDGKVENYDDRAIIAMLVAEVQRLNAEIDKLKGR